MEAKVFTPFFEDSEVLEEGKICIPNPLHFPPLSSFSPKTPSFTQFPAPAPAQPSNIFSRPFPPPQPGAALQQPSDSPLPQNTIPFCPPTDATSPSLTPNAPAAPLVFKACVNCTDASVKECIYCLRGWCASHTPAHPYPDANGALAFKCHLCEKKSNSGVSFVEPRCAVGPSAGASLSNIAYQPIHLTPAPSQQLTNLFAQNIRSSGVCATIIADDENTIKDYIVSPFRRCEIIEKAQMINDMMDIRTLIQPAKTILLHYRYDPDNIMSPIKLQPGQSVSSQKKLLEEANIVIGILCRRAIPFNPERRTIDRDKSLHLRLEFWITNPLWETLTSLQRRQIKYFQLITEDIMYKAFQIWNSDPSKKSKTALTLVNTRDSFKIKLIPATEEIIVGERRYTKTVWFFPEDTLPDGYDPVVHGRIIEGLGVPVGVTTYNGVFTRDELQRVEDQIDGMDHEARNGKYNHLPNTRQETLRGDKVVRTKFFFGARYLWTKEQTSDKKEASRASGVRVDVADPPTWLKTDVEATMVSSQVVSEGFINSFAVNIYHDGSEGLHQHYDDLKRFAQPIFTLRLYSDSRLAFGAHGLAMTNPLFFIPMPRGCITVLEDKSYAANAVKHCIRPADMSEKSAAIILRHIHNSVLQDAQTLLGGEEIAAWVRKIEGLHNANEVIASFAKEEITMESLHLLTECDLKLLGMHSMGPRKIVLGAIDKLREAAKINVHHCPCSCECPNYIRTSLNLHADRFPLNDVTNLSPILAKRLAEVSKINDRSDSRKGKHTPLASPIGSPLAAKHTHETASPKNLNSNFPPSTTENQPPPTPQTKDNPFPFSYFGTPQKQDSRKRTLFPSSANTPSHFTIQSCATSTSSVGTFEMSQDLKRQKSMAIENLTDASIPPLTLPPCSSLTSPAPSLPLSLSAPQESL